MPHIAKRGNSGTNPAKARFMAISKSPADQASRLSIDDTADYLETASAIVLVAFLSSLTVIVLL
jgi:hypothetical protein